MSFREEMDKALDKFLSEVYTDSEDEHHVVRAVVRPDVFNSLRQDLVALHEREKHQAKLDAITEFVSFSAKVKRRIDNERRRANGEG